MSLKKKFQITGMTCSACSSRVQKVVSKLEGVSQVEVNLLTNTMVVAFNKEVTIEKIIKTVEKAGYGASIFEPKENIAEREIKEMKVRLWVSIICLIPLLYIAMGHMLGAPLPSIFHEPLFFTLAQLVLTLPILWVNKSYFIHGFRNLFKGSPNMDSLIAIGSTAAFLYGIYAFIKMILALQIDDQDTVQHFMMNLYFESAGMIVALITVGKYLEKRAKGKTSEAIQKLMNLSPKVTTIIKDGKEIQIPTQEVKIGDRVVIKPGESIPVDGEIIQGETYVDQSALTGESVEVKKRIGDQVMTASMNQNGVIHIIAQKVGEDTTLAQIIHLVEEASSSKAPIGKLADKISGVFVPIVIVIAILASFIWILVGMDIEFALSIGISILVISCPCALGLATPVSIMVATGKGAQKGILIKSAESLENAHLIDTVVLDKTGTITQGKTKVTQVMMDEEITKEEQLWKIVGSLENNSEHPIARAICQYVKEKEIENEKVEAFEVVSGKGIKGKIGQENYMVGNQLWMQEEEKSIKESLKQEAIKLNKEAKTVIFVANDKAVLGIIAISDVIKEDSKQAVEMLKKEHIDVIMLTGDQEEVAKEIASQVGIDKVISQVLPQDKEKVVRNLQEEGKNVAMVGDGINDSPALARANVGIAIAAGTDIAMESADIVLVKNSLLDVATAIRLSKATIQNIKMNLFWAFFYNSIGIPIAAGILYPFFGFTLNPMIAAAAMSLSSICVVTNSLRLRRFQ
ncbi:MAG: heavy metal translocating P-type ATPase [Clostridia bacterium]